MPKSRIVAIVSAFLFCLLLSGCMKTWSVTFNDGGDVEGWNIVQLSFDNDYQGVTQDGLILDGYEAIAPFAFTGDCKVTFRFHLICNNSDPWRFASVHLADENDLHTNSIYLSLGWLGKLDEEGYWVLDNAAGLAFGGLVPLIDRNGINTVEFSKESSAVTVKLNGGTLYSGPFSEYSLDYVVPRLYASKVLDNDSVLIFKSVKVQYEGERLAL